MATIKDQVEKINKLKARLAVWEAILQLVEEKFISKDGRRVSGIKISNTGELVSEDIIEDILKFISDGEVETISTEISDIENGEVITLGENKVTA